MHVSRLHLHDFRNYQRLDLELTPGITLLYGPNAAGKTSLLEALFYLATTRSPRASTDRELVRWDAAPEAGVPPFARIAADVQQARGLLRLEVTVQVRRDAPTTDITLRPQGATQKRMRINRKPVRALDLVGNLRVVLFTPADLVLVHGSPGERRRYLDITLSQLDPRYVRTLAHYNKLVQQRNSLLRAWRERRRPLRAVDDELAYWDQELTTSGGYILAERLRAVHDLNHLVGPLFGEITGGDQPLTLRYQASTNLHEQTTQAAHPDAAAIAQHMRAQLTQQRRDELHRGQTLTGPHRDDILFSVNDVNLGVYGSRGQQRSVALALKLGEARLMQQRSGETPVLLLDDLLSELDMQRRTHLLQTVVQPGQQTVLTATDTSQFDAHFLQQATRIRIEQGTLYPL